MRDDWTDLLFALLDAEVRFLVVGAHAMGVHGVPRATRDLDVWVEPSHGNAERVWRALTAFGAPLDALRLEQTDFADRATVVQLGVPPVRVDVLTDISGVPDFAAAWAARSEHDVHGRSVPFIGREALIANKRASGRPKDLADLDALGELPRA
ncbi:MAG: hypothetical protein Q8Q85_12795 [Gemmatimonadales bacterium]|nr:hypothetical protein [Gemmatimonadales bacterium]